MLDRSVYAARRRRLRELVDGPILLMGNGQRARNLPMTPLPFRQDSNLLYLTGCTRPDAAALLADGQCILFLPEAGPEDALWHGPEPSPEQVGEALGVDEVRPRRQLADTVEGLLDVRTLAVADEEQNRVASRLTGIPLRFGADYGSDDLVRAVIALRRVKTDVELEELRKACHRTDLAHTAAMRATRPGGHERALTALFEGVLAAHDSTPGYGTILTQRGEVLHNHHHDAELQAGKLLLLDGGGEVPTGYGADVTRTWPVDGTFAPRQRAAYEAVLAAQLEAIDTCRVGVRYREVHFAACRVLARFLADEGLLRVSPEVAVEIGAHALFFPHGVGHHLGMDVHDLESFGDLPSYPPGQGRPQQFGTRNLRLDLPLEAGWVVTVEPGFYVVPAILEDQTLRERFAHAVDLEAAERWLGFGGIRIEDDVAITPAGPEVLTRAPKTVDAVEGIVGTGVPAEERLC